MQLPFMGTVMMDDFFTDTAAAQSAASMARCRCLFQITAYVVFPADFIENCHAFALDQHIAQGSQ